MENHEVIGKLRVVAVSGMAVETLTADVWKEMVTVLIENEDKGVDKLHDLCRDMEQQFKLDFSVSAMPPAYRSAKSVGLTALRNGVKLMDEGVVRGKTAVEADIRTVKTVAGVVDTTVRSTAAPRNDDDKLTDAIDEVYNLVFSGARPVDVVSSKNRLEWVVSQL